MAFHSIKAVSLDKNKKTPQSALGPEYLGMDYQRGYHFKAAGKFCIHLPWLFSWFC